MIGKMLAINKYWPKWAENFKIYNTTVTAFRTRILSFY